MVFLRTTFTRGAGYFFGAIVGFAGAAGRFVGATVGRFVGTAVGRMFGATDGITLGIAVGELVGAAGRFVGTTVGRFVGTAVGRMFGATDGITLGLAVGVFVGELVGVALGFGNKEAPSTSLSVEYPIFVRSSVRFNVGYVSSSCSQDR